jgi:hypothetical protein
MSYGQPCSRTTYRAVGRADVDVADIQKAGIDLTKRAK